jgi:hypothetical protein
MSDTRPPAVVAASPIARAEGRQILFYAPAGLLGGTFTCSRCGATGRQPDVIEHARECTYGIRGDARG